MMNAIKPFSKPEITCLYPYFGNVTFDRLKKLPKCYKKNGECCKTGLTASEHTFLEVSWQQYIHSMQNNLKNVLKKGTRMP